MSQDEDEVGAQGVGLLLRQPHFPGEGDQNGLAAVVVYAGALVADGPDLFQMTHVSLSFVKSSRYFTLSMTIWS